MLPPGFPPGGSPHRFENLAMTCLEEPIHFIGSESADSLRTITTDGVNLAIWRRDRAAATDSAVHALLAVPYAVAIDEKAPDVARLFCCLQQIIGSRAPTVSIRALAEDIALLSGLFSDLAKTVHRDFEGSHLDN